MQTTFDYLIVGGGMVADAAARGIREVDADGSIGILSEDVDGPYARPALSKKLWTDPEFEWSDADLATATDTGAAVLTATVVTSVDPQAHTVRVQGGLEYGYGRLLLATGGHPRTLDAAPSDNVIYFRSAADYRRLRALADRHCSVAVIGGSFIGTELAAALTERGCDVTLVTADATLGASMLPGELSTHVDGVFAAHGIDIVRHARVKSLTEDADGVLLALDGAGTVRADAAVVGLGIVPAIGLAERAGIEIADGILVDAGLRTSALDVYAAGDVAEYPDPVLGRRRIEHVDNAVAMGTVVGFVLAGREEIYTHTPYYYSEHFGTRYEAIGTVDASLSSMADWSEPLRAGTVYYLDAGVPVGVLLWGVPAGGIEELRQAARDLLAESVVVDPAQLRGRIRVPHRSL